MSPYAISTDIMSDLPADYLKEHSIETASLSYMMDNFTYDRNHPLDEKEFYSKMRSGQMPTTSQVTPDEALRCFKAIVDSGQKDILHISFSSALSGTYQSCMVAATEMMEWYPDVRIHVIDSRAASLGQGLIVSEAIARRDAGEDYEEVIRFLENHINNFVHLFTVDDLFHLYRGGRVKRSTAIVGSLVNIKPILNVDEEGRLIPHDKVRGRKKSIKELAEKASLIAEHSDFMMGNNFYISHGDCLEEALMLADLMEEKTDLKRGIINYVGPTIGAHSGPGTLALFFCGKHR